MLDPRTISEVSGPPEVSTHAQAWHGHVPFARWLLGQTSPKIFVELGVFLGDSYLTICETILRKSLGTKCFGIDTWEGDVHAGEIVEGSLETLRAFHNPRYSGFSTLMPMRFDQALDRFENGTVDLLHIDGLHTYEAVREDFETWLPKLSSRGVVLFHDSAVRDGDFGVFRLLEELSPKYPCFEFDHSHGLTVLAVGEKLDEAISWLTTLKGEERQAVKNTFAHLGAAAAVHAAFRKSGLYQVDDDWNDACNLNQRALAFEDMLNLKNQVIGGLRENLASLENSTSWRITAPVRKIMDVVRGRK